jgi:hypothetical protein
MGHVRTIQSATIATSTKRTSSRQGEFVPKSLPKDEDSQDPDQKKTVEIIHQFSFNNMYYLFRSFFEHFKDEDFPPEGRRDTVYSQLMDQLDGEKLRSEQLSTKIKELHDLVEEHRLNARSAAEERDRYRHASTYMLNFDSAIFDTIDSH